ncbi:hypothetical protein C8J57DRAFT_1284906 [Mycena rebaudengoi]|nr:hypothetical protein C8J57DRAFT_1284906 [Mycena rebaudengoi]
MSVALPAYVSIPAPSYASLPLPTEDTLEYTPRVRRAAAQRNITKQWKNITIILKNQDDSSEIPTYGWPGNTIVCGEIGLDLPDNIQQVTLKLEGRLHLSSSDCGSIRIKIVNEQRTLWAHSGSKRCPSLLPFSVAFPMSYKYEGRTWRMPPSYEVVCLGSPLLVAKCTYSLSITMTKTRNTRLAFWKKTHKTYPIKLIFRPRTRPGRPVLETNSLFSTLKVSPEEWRQMIVPMPTRQHKIEVEPISCHLFVPSVGTHPLAQVIPFHIQLCGPVESLRYFYGSIPFEPTPSGKKPRTRESTAVIRVYLARQIFVQLNGRQSWRNVLIGEGKLRPIPPRSSVCSLHLDSSEVSVDWEGEVRCNNDVTCASFSVGNLVVKDFIIFQLTPANVRTSPLLPIQHSHPIRLVTDRWEDVAHPSDL